MSFLSLFNVGFANADTNLKTCKLGGLMKSLCYRSVREKGRTENKRVIKKLLRFLKDSFKNSILTYTWVGSINYKCVLVSFNQLDYCLAEEGKFHRHVSSSNFKHCKKEDQETP